MARFAGGLFVHSYSRREGRGVRMQMRRGLVVVAALVGASVAATGANADSASQQKVTRSRRWRSPPRPRRATTAGTRRASRAQPPPPSRSERSSPGHERRLRQHRERAAPARRQEARPADLARVRLRHDRGAHRAADGRADDHVRRDEEPRQGQGRRDHDLGQPGRLPRRHPGRQDDEVRHRRHRDLGLRHELVPDVRRLRRRRPQRLASRRRSSSRRSAPPPTTTPQAASASPPA